MQNASATPAQNGGNSPLPASDKPVKELDKAQMPPKVLPSQQTAAQHTNTNTTSSPGISSAIPGAESAKTAAQDSTTPVSTPMTAETSSSSEQTAPPPSENNQSSSDNNSGGGTTAQKSKRMGKIIGGLALLVLVVGGALSALFLTETGQDIRNQAAYYNQNVTSKGLKVPNSSEPGSSSASNYKPASSNPNESYYDQGAGDRVSFSTNITNESGGTVQDKYQLLAFRIDRVDDREDGWMDVDENTPMSERRMYENHRDNGDCPSGNACFKGTEQTLVHSGGWKDFTINAGETKTLTDTWKPGADDCGMYQLDMQVESAGGDKIVAVGMIRVKNCQQKQETVSIKGSVVCYENTNGKQYRVLDVPVTVHADGTTQTIRTGTSGGGAGHYESKAYNAGTGIAARLSIPATFSVAEVQNGQIVGSPIQVSRSNLKVVNPNKPAETSVINAFNGCNDSFMQSNCGGISSERAQQCQNAPARSDGKAPDSYEYCSLQGGSTQRINFDFAIYGCVQEDEPEPEPKQCNESCNAALAPCDPGPNGTIKCVATPEGQSVCRDTRFPTQSDCKPPVTPPPPGAMCIGLCGISSTEAEIGTSAYTQCPAGGGAANGTAITVGDYIHFRCQYRNADNIRIVVTKPDGTTQQLQTTYRNVDDSHIAKYQVQTAGTVSASCEVITGN